MSALFAAGSGTGTNARSGRDAILEKLRTMIVPKVDFNGATLEEVIEYIRVRSRDLDPKGRGVDFVMNLPAGIIRQARQPLLGTGAAWKTSCATSRRKPGPPTAWRIGR